MVDPLNDTSRAQALLSQPGGSTVCVGARPPAHRRALRLKSLWTGLALIATVAGAMHIMGGKSHHDPQPAVAAVATHAAAQMVHGTAPAQALAAPRSVAAAPAAHPVVTPAPLPVPTVATTAPAPVTMPSAPTVAAPVVHAQSPMAFGSQDASPRAAPVPVVALAASTVHASPAHPATPPAVAGTGRPLMKLPITVTPDDTTLTLSKKLSDAGQDFPALATSIEVLRTSVYYDGCGANIGMGYCITNRIANHGRQQVHEELLDAGIPAPSVDALMSSKHKIQKGVTISSENALRLLYVVTPEYETIARDAVGPTFDKLPRHRQAAVTWLAYNTGDVASFKALVHGVQHDNVRQAMEHMTPWFRDTTNQVMVKNERAGAYLQGAYYSEAGLKKVIDDPAAFEDRTLVHKESPIAAVDPAAAKALKKKGELPTSPTVGPNTKPLPGAVDASATGSGARWAPAPLNARKVGDWQARQAPAAAPDDDMAVINRSVTGPSR